MLEGRNGSRVTGDGTEGVVRNGQGPDCCHQKSSMNTAAEHAGMLQVFCVDPQLGFRAHLNTNDES